MPRKIFIVILLIATVLWTAFIFSNSLKDSAQSSEQSSNVTEVVNKVADAVGVEEEIPHSTVRSMAHFFEFALLCTLLCADVTLILWQKIKQRYLLHSLCGVASIAVCFIFAIVDELLQKLSDGRACDIADVALDTLGALCGAAVFAVGFAVFEFIRKHKIKGL